MENWDLYALTFAAVSETEAELAFRCLSEWAEPDDQFTMEDRHAVWNYCVGQLASFTVT